MTINTLQRRIDNLENLLVKSEAQVGYKEPQRSEAPREEVDDLIIGVRERVTRFVLGRVSEQLDALENQSGNSGLNVNSIREKPASVNVNIEQQPPVNCNMTTPNTQRTVYQ